MTMKISDLMAQSGVKFGTSGVRGLVADMTDTVCQAFSVGFLQYLEALGELKRAGEPVAVAGDLRPSTERIMRAVAQAAAGRGYQPVNGGRIPSPAVALYGLEHACPAIMVTGSHIPADRNGIKFNKCSGELMKQDEARICEQMVMVNDSASPGANLSLPPEQPAAGAAYVARYLSVFPSDSLAGRRIGIYQHSAVGRELLVQLFEGLGAETVPLGFSETFVPVDTEAIRPEDENMARQWAQKYALDAIISTDGDGDRPLISDETGQWLRGDVTGILAARYLGADSVSTPINCNTALERSNWFADIRRTKIGSPFVVASMLAATESGSPRVVGYEANGGFLTNSAFELFGGVLRALPTRDAVLPALAVLLLAKKAQQPVSALLAELPQRFTASGRIQGFPVEESRRILEGVADAAAVERVFGERFGLVAEVDRTDGVRVTFGSGEVLHMRPSGNAPEFRCYNEAASESRVREMQRQSMAKLLELKG